MFKRVDEMLTLFDLHRYEDVSPATLGYGERRAVALSSVLAMRTPILVLDEAYGRSRPPSRSTSSSAPSRNSTSAASPSS